MLTLSATATHKHKHTGGTHTHLLPSPLSAYWGGGVHSVVVLGSRQVGLRYYLLSISHGHAICALAPSFPCSPHRQRYHEINNTKSCNKRVISCHSKIIASALPACLPTKVGIQPLLLIHRESLFDLVKRTSPAKTKYLCSLTPGK